MRGIVATREDPHPAEKEGWGNRPRLTKHGN
jgi:hypothetical protein